MCEINISLLSCFEDIQGSDSSYRIFMYIIHLRDSLYLHPHASHVSALSLAQSESANDIYRCSRDLTICPRFFSYAFFLYLNSFCRFALFVLFSSCCSCLTSFTDCRSPSITRSLAIERETEIDRRGIRANTLKRENSIRR